jgi:mono/diheme cytochrome c family protein
MLPALKFAPRPNFAALLALGLLAALSPSADAQKKQLPEGPGKVTTQRICSGCHAAEIVIGKQLDRDGWEQVVSSMVDKGATGTDDEFNQIIDYLATNFPKSQTSDKNYQK